MNKGYSALPPQHEVRPVTETHITVLIVDDDADIRDLLRAAVHRHPRLVLSAEAPNGTTALVLARRYRPDVVILDLGLPDVTGQTLLTELRDCDPDIRIVVFTGNEPASQEAARALGADAVVQKGDAVRDLLNAVEAVARPGDIAHIDLPATTSSAASSRRFIADHLIRWGCLGLIDDAQLVVTELVANAVVHASSRCRVTIRRDRKLVRIEVTDYGPGTPEPQAPSTTRPRGRGLMLVSALSTAWGIDPLDDGTDGKVVWVQLTA